MGKVLPSKPKIVHFSQALSSCLCYNRIFHTEFETDSTDSYDEFLKKLRDADADAVVVCFCSAQDQDIDELLKLDALAGTIPVIACSRNLSLDFVSSAARQGVKRFLLCTMGKEKIHEIIHHAIRGGELKEFLEQSFSDSLTSSLHVRRMIDKITHAFPSRLDERDMARKLGISQSWLQKLCRQAFGKSYTRLMRRIWIHQALHLMRHTTLDNGEIALQLNYSEESNMARDFRKELGCNPTEARKLLSRRIPEEILI